MQRPQGPHPQRGFIQYVVLGLVLVIAAGATAFLLSRKSAPSTSNLTASLTGSGGVTITSPDANASLTSPVHVAANVASAFAGPVKSMRVSVDGATVYQTAGTSVDTQLSMSNATHNITVEALKANGRLEGSATVSVTVVAPTPTPFAPPSASSIPPLPPVPSP